MTERLRVSETPRDRWRFAWALPVLLTLGLYLFTLRYPFIFDDTHDILEARWVHHLWPPEWLWKSRRSVVFFTWALNWAWSGPAPWSYRLVNVFIHAANAALLWHCARRALRDDPNRQGNAAPLATAIATLWAAHPLHTTAVTYVVHRYESLAALFMLATLASWQRALVSAQSRRWVALAALWAVCAVLSKEIAAVMPALLIAYDFAFNRQRPHRGRALAAIALSSWAIAALAYALAPPVETQGVSVHLSRGVYFRSEFHVLARYLRLVVAPWPLSVDYSDWPIAAAWRPVDVASFALIASLVACGAGAFFTRAPRVGWLSFVCVAVLAPTSTVIPLSRELLAERRMYLPLAALMALGVLGVHRAARGRMAVVGAFAVAATVALSSLTVRRNLDFQTCQTLFSHELIAHPQSGRLHHSMAVCLVKYGRNREAYEHYDRALRLDPGCCVIHPPMAGVALRLGWEDLALQHLNAQIALHPTDTTPWIGAINVLLSVGSDARALRVADRAAARFPDAPEVAERRAWVLATARDESVVNGERAVREAQRAIERTAQRPLPVSRAVTLAAAMAAAGRLNDARALASLVRSRAHEARDARWERTLDEQLGAYASGRRWIESGRRHGDALLSP